MSEDLKIPLIVGITGHIDIAEDETYIAEQLDLFWKHLRRIVGPETPIVLLSSIAQGADHYVVKYCPEDVRYAVVLPFELEAYQRDFETPEALEDFKQDLAGAFKVITCKAEPGDYTAGSDYVRTRADVLLSMWDGTEALDAAGNPKKGGTYDQIKEAFNLNDLLVDHQEKIHLSVNLAVTRKRTQPGKRLFQSSVPLEILTWEEDKDCFSGKPFADYDPDNADDLTDSENCGGSIIKRIGNFNRNIPQTIEIDEWVKQDILQAGNAEIQQQKLDFVHKDLVRFSYFDKEALKHQELYRKQFNWILLISFIAAICSQLSKITFSAHELINAICVNSLMFLFFIGIFFALILNRFYIKKTDDYQKYCDNRVVAELMRLKIFWSLAGIREELSEMVLTESGDFFCALPLCNWEVSSILPSSGNTIDDELENQMPTVRKAWIQNQLNYYRTRTIPKFKKWHHQTKFWANIFYGMSVSLALFFIMHTFFFNEIDLLGWCGLHHNYYRGMLISIGPFIFASLGWLLEKKQWGAMAEAYSHMADLFEKTEKKFEKLDAELASGTVSMEKCILLKQQFIKELMFYCHIENNEWKDIRSNSKPEPMI